MKRGPLGVWCTLRPEMARFVEQILEWTENWRAPRCSLVMARGRRILGPALLAIVVGACGSDRRDDGRSVVPTAPTRTVLPLLGGPPVNSRLVAFPPRNEAFTFRNDLERKYRDELGRQATNSFFNAPFTMDLAQFGTRVSGRYQDQHDAGFVAGTASASGAVMLDVNFGDTGIRYEGAFDGPDRVRGIVRGSVIGGPYTFEMTR